MYASRLVTVTVLLLWTLFCFYAVASGHLMWAFIWIIPAFVGIAIGLLVRWKEARS